jgi:hypothetical protein
MGDLCGSLIPALLLIFANLARGKYMQMELSAGSSVY